MFTAGGLKSVLLWRGKESGGVDTGGAPGWAGSPHVDVQSLENNLESRPRGVMVVARRWPTERGRQLCFCSACLLKSRVCRTSSCHGSASLLRPAALLPHKLICSYISNSWQRIVKYLVTV